MIAFEIIENGLEIGAIVLKTEAANPQLKILYKLLPPGARFDAELARRWNVSGVLCDPDWAAEQKKRVPMLRPRGVPAAFLAGKTGDESEWVRAVELRRQDEAANKILTLVASHFRVMVVDLVGRQQHERILWPRRICFWLLRNCLPASFNYIGELMGGREHNTVLTGIQVLEDRINTESKFAAVVSQLEKQARGIAAIERK